MYMYMYTRVKFCQFVGQILKKVWENHTVDFNGGRIVSSYRSRGRGGGFRGLLVGLVLIFLFLSKILSSLVHWIEICGGKCSRFDRKKKSKGKQANQIPIVLCCNFKKKRN